MWNGSYLLVPSPRCSSLPSVRGCMDWGVGPWSKKGWLWQLLLSHCGWHWWLWYPSLCITPLQNNYGMGNLILILYTFFFLSHQCKHSRMHLECFTDFLFCEPFSLGLFSVLRKMNCWLHLHSVVLEIMYSVFCLPTTRYSLGTDSHF